jgi:type VI secretion system protein ImpB
MAITDEIPKSRITLTYRTEVHGEREDVALPFRVLVMGDLSNNTSKDRKLDLDQRQLRGLDGKNLDAVIKDMGMSLKMTVPNKINPQEGAGEMEIDLPIKGIKSFSPAEIARNVPKLKALLLLEAQANLDNRKDFRKLMRDLATNKDAITALKGELQGFETFKLPQRAGDGNGGQEG